MHFFSSISFVSRTNSILSVFAFFVFCASFLVISPTPLSAASFTGSIVGCGNITVSNCETADERPGKLITGECSFCDVMDVIQKILNFLVFAVMIVATLLFCYAGVLYLFSAPSMGNIEKAHKIFWNVAIGLVITLASWLIIDTVMKILYDDAGGSAIRQEYGPWNNILCPSRVQATCEATEEKKVVQFRLEGVEVINPNTGARIIAHPVHGTVGLDSRPTGTGAASYSLRHNNQSIPNQMQGQFDTFTQFIYDATDANPGSIVVTEGYPPSRVHGSSCHRDGTCVDITYSGQDKSLVSLAASAAGGQAVYETNNLAEYNSLAEKYRAMGLTVAPAGSCTGSNSRASLCYLPTCDNTNNGRCVTGPHYSYYSIPR